MPLDDVANVLALLQLHAEEEKKGLEDLKKGRGQRGRRG